MGAWGSLPWDNDAAADWYGDLFEQTKLAERVEEALRRDAMESHEDIRAAAAVLLLLGQNYVWPIDHIDRHLALAAERLEELLRLEIYAEDPEAIAHIQNEISELRSRIPGAAKLESATPTVIAGQPMPKWWHFNANL